MKKSELFDLENQKLLVIFESGVFSVELEIKGCKKMSSAENTSHLRSLIMKERRKAIQ